MIKAEIERKLKKITDKIVRKYRPEKIILFGSYAWGEPGPDSDVDLLVVKNSLGSTREIAREIDSSIFPRSFPLDILVYSHQELEIKINQDRNLFLEDIVRNGRVLYAKTHDNITFSHRPAELVL